ncbi:MAG: radical SAM protein [Candidatus Odinarchaeum yellowstonii]|uniref:Radical SAM protein n=1 Tax=Odinarchaeota yellowstonii (strain LCB_4) TaxID=1841599 RepID=A0AAF0IBT1_ODILC|nr:MAG: radical SAM protein [Candidatus Odinarchaeum yellowstonii]
MREEIKRSIGGSYFIRTLPKGCEYCMKGSKIVVFITGRCFAKCYYCPLSENRRNSDEAYVNELKITTDETILREARLIEAEGAGLTGGDPLFKFELTIKYIKLLKERFGSKFHIHLYTTGFNLNREKAEMLIESGLDEIRFNPIGDFEDKIKLFKGSTMKLGCEIPAIPGEEEKIKKLIKTLDESGVDFININELEFSETNAGELKKRGLTLKKDSVAAAEGSEESALKILEWSRKNTEKISVHYCPTWIKDGVQLKNRFLRRARNVKKSYEEVDEEGLLVRGVIYAEKQINIDELKRLLIEKYEVPENMLDVNRHEREVYTAWYIVEELKSELEKFKIKTGIVKSYPTDDRLKVIAYYL